MVIAIHYRLTDPVPSCLNSINNPVCRICYFSPVNLSLAVQDLFLVPHHDDHIPLFVAAFGIAVRLGGFFQRVVFVDQRLQLCLPR